MTTFWKNFRQWLDGVEPLDTEDAEILSNHHRRAAIKVLSNQEDEHITLTDLSHEIAELEHGSNYSRTQRKSIYSSIHGAHLESLNKYQLIDYSTDPCLNLRATPDLLELEQYIEKQPAEDSLFYEFDQEDSGFTANKGFRALSNHRSRFTIDHIDENGTSTLREMYTELAAEENNKRVEELDFKVKNRCYVGLKQTHLPLLEEIDVVELNENEDTIYRGENLGTLSKYIP